MNHKMCCYYSPSHHHQQCTHKRDCIFRRKSLWTSIIEFQEDAKHQELHGLLDDIWTVKKRINDLKKVNNEYMNGNILYHPFMDNYYNIDLTRDEQGELVINMSIKANFKNHIRTVIEQSEMELRELKRELFHQRRNL